MPYDFDRIRDMLIANFLFEQRFEIEAGCTANREKVIAERADDIVQSFRDAVEPRIIPVTGDTYSLQGPRGAIAGELAVFRIGEVSSESLFIESIESPPLVKVQRTIDEFNRFVYSGLWSKISE